VPWDEQKLRYFWNSIAKQSDKVKLLKEMANVKIFSKDSYIERRVEFYKDNKLRRTRKCLVCRESADIRHHIILLKHGGKNIPRNIVSLCNKCHELIHPWLKNKNVESTATSCSTVVRVYESDKKDEPIGVIGSTL